jgi:hypothetical protein
MRRRAFLGLASAAGLSAAWKVPAFAAADKVTVGYVHAVAVDRVGHAATFPVFGGWF